MILHHLLRMSLENLAVRWGRSLFLVISVAVGTGTLAFLIATVVGPGIVTSLRARKIAPNAAISITGSKLLLGSRGIDVFASTRSRRAWMRASSIRPPWCR